jgi:hypothetical protein
LRSLPWKGRLPPESLPAARQRGEEISTAASQIPPGSRSISLVQADQACLAEGVFARFPFKLCRTLIRWEAQPLDGKRQDLELVVMWLKRVSMMNVAMRLLPTTSKSSNGADDEEMC